MTSFFTRVGDLAAAAAAAAAAVPPPPPPPNCITIADHIKGF